MELQHERVVGRVSARRQRRGHVEHAHPQVVAQVAHAQPARIGTFANSPLSNDSPGNRGSTEPPWPTGWKMFMICGYSSSFSTGVLTSSASFASAASRRSGFRVATTTARLLTRLIGEAPSAFQRSSTWVVAHDEDIRASVNRASVLMRVFC